MRLEWSIHAFEDLVAFFDYIEVDNPLAAVTIDDRIRHHVQQLTRHPQSGRIGRVENTRELVIDRTPYIVAYHVVPDAVRVLHSAQMWPDGLPE